LKSTARKCLIFGWSQEKGELSQLFPELSQLLGESTHLSGGLSQQIDESSHLFPESSHLWGGLTRLLGAFSQLGDESSQVKADSTRLKPDSVHAGGEPVPGAGGRKTGWTTIYVQPNLQFMKTDRPQILRPNYC